MNESLNKFGFKLSKSPNDETRADAGRRQEVSEAVRGRYRRSLRPCLPGRAGRWRSCRETTRRRSGARAPEAGSARDRSGSRIRGPRPGFGARGRGRVSEAASAESRGTYYRVRRYVVVWIREYTTNYGRRAREVFFFFFFRLGAASPSRSFASFSGPGVETAMCPPTPHPHRSARAPPGHRGAAPWPAPARASCPTGRAQPRGSARWKAARSRVPRVSPPRRSPCQQPSDRLLRVRASAGCVRPPRAPPRAPRRRCTRAHARRPARHSGQLPRRPRGRHRRVGVRDKPRNVKTIFVFFVRGLTDRFAKIFTFDTFALHCA